MAQFCCCDRCGATVKFGEGENWAHVSAVVRGMSFARPKEIDLCPKCKPVVFAALETAVQRP